MTNSIIYYVIKIQSVLHWPICNVLPQFNVSGINSSLLCNNVLIHWCWLLLLLLAGYCQRVELVTFGFLPHSTVVHHSTNQCSNNEWNSTRDWSECTVVISVPSTSKLVHSHDPQVHSCILSTPMIQVDSPACILYLVSQSVDLVSQCTIMIQVHSHDPQAH